jgi:hypothetical protein
MTQLCSTSPENPISLWTSRAAIRVTCDRDPRSMQMTPAVSIVLMIALQTGLPAFLAYGLWRSRDPTRSIWWLRAAYTSAYVAYFFLTGRWDFVSYYLRFVILGLLFVTLIAGYVRSRQLPWRINGRPGGRLTLVSSAATLVAFIALLTLAIRGFWYDGDPVRLSSPLRDDVYYVAQGGNSALLNYHNVNRAQRYAVDVVALNMAGARASAIYSSDLEEYVIFGARVYSPCEGSVIEVVDGLADNVPPHTDRAHPAGNHIVIDCPGARVVLAHLQRDSVGVRASTTIARGDLVGRVGNSGNTSEPHLHVHAVRGHADVMTGEGIPIVFEGVFPVRNTVFRKD